MGPRLIGLASLVARRQGTAAARALLRAGQRWMADPANEEAKRALLEQLRTAAEIAGVAAGRISGRLAREVEKRRVSVGAWERDLMSLRYEIADMAAGPVREAAVAAYANQARAGVVLARDERTRREVLDTLDAELRMLRGESLSPAERAEAEAAVAAAREACAAVDVARS
jgi:hypothetical protein